LLTTSIIGASEMRRSFAAWATSVAVEGSASETRMSWSAELDPIAGARQAPF